MRVIEKVLPVQASVDQIEDVHHEPVVSPIDAAATAYDDVRALLGAQISVLPRANTIGEPQQLAQNI